MQLLENEVIRLRALEPEDLDTMYKWENDTELWSVGPTIEPYSRYIIKEYIAYSDKTIYEKKQLRLMIELKESKTAIGCIDLYDFDFSHLRAGVGILIEKKYQKNGYASGALNLLKEYSFSFLHLHQLYSLTPTTNTASVKLFEKEGFKRSGTLNDWIFRSGKFNDVFFYTLIKPE